MPPARLPLQLGRGALAQSARLAATVWLGPLLLLVAAMALGHFFIVLILGTAGILMLGVAWMAAENAARERPADALLDDDGLTIEGGPLDGKHFTRATAARCTIVPGEPRLAVRWLLLSWLTANKIPWLVARAHVPVAELRIPAHGDPVVLAEAEGDERESLAQLRDIIVARPSPESAPGELSQEILRCPACNAAQVPIDQPTMTCPYCAHALDVPAELIERVHARTVLDRTSAPQARLVSALIAQPGARWSGRVVVTARRLMVWIQPVAIVGVVWAMVRSLSSSSTRFEMRRVHLGDNAVLLYDLGVFVVVIAAAIALTWTVGSAYLSNRRALRILTEGFGAVPPIAPGAPSTCRQCSAPLAAAPDALLVHCVYCQAENVLGVDPRPAAARRTHQTQSIGEALRHRRRARIRVWLALPVSLVIAYLIGHQVVLAWWIPTAAYTDDAGTSCAGYCGQITNDDLVPRTVVRHVRDESSRSTVLPHTTVAWECFDKCTIDSGGTSFTTEGLPEANESNIQLRIRHGELIRPAR